MEIPLQLLATLTHASDSKRSLFLNIDIGNTTSIINHFQKNQSFQLHKLHLNTGSISMFGNIR